MAIGYRGIELDGLLCRGDEALALGARQPASILGGCARRLRKSAMRIRAGAHCRGNGERGLGGRIALVERQRLLERLDREAIALLAPSVEEVTPEEVLVVGVARGRARARRGVAPRR